MRVFLYLIKTWANFLRVSNFKLGNWVGHVMYVRLSIKFPKFTKNFAKNPEVMLFV
jgi:hypothetical protein